MKVIFLKDVPRVGQRFQVKEVAQGYANNMLFPQKLAEPATKEALKRLEIFRGSEEAQKGIRENILNKNIDDIEGTSISLVGKANELGHLFAGIHKKEIAEAIFKKTRLDIPEEFILLDKSIREIGEYKISVSIHDRKAVFNLSVESA